jgi:hypothetical protein
LPFGGNLHEGALDAIIDGLHAALTFGRNSPGEFSFDPEAEAEWVRVYPVLSADRTGLAGALLSRAEAQTLRLTMLYAALDSARTIRIEHLRASLAVWHYSERSVAFIFRDKTGNPLADQILSSLLEKGSEGLSRTEIHELVSRHVLAAEVDQALGALRALGLAVMASTKTKGRPEQRWFAKKGREGRGP